MDQRLIYNALEFFRLHWTLEILASLTSQPQRFNELQRSVQAVHATAFSTALRRLVDHSLVYHPAKGDGMHYTLTARGALVLPLLEAFIEAIRWCEAAQQPVPKPSDARES